MPSNTHETTPPALPDPARNSGPGVPAHLEGLVETAKDYARGAKAAGDPAGLRGRLAPLRPPGAAARTSTPCPRIRRPSGSISPPRRPIRPRRQAQLGAHPRAPALGIAWYCTQNGTPLDRADRHIAEVMAGIRRRHGKPPDQKEPVLGDELLRMIATLGHDLRGLRDRAILMLGFAGGLRRSELVSLDCGPDQTVEGAGWIAFLPDGIVIKVRGKTGWREVEVGRGSSTATCPVAALKTWLDFARIAHGPLFRSIAGGTKVGADR